MVSPVQSEEEDISALEVVTKKRKKKRKIETIENETEGGEKVEEVINNQRKDIRRSWAVVMATFLLVFIETGVVTTLGVLLPDIREQFATKTWVVGFAIALVPGFGSVVCLVSGAVSKALTPSTTIAVCGLLFSVGLLGSFLAANVYILMFCFLLTGFSAGTTTVSLGMLSKYFDKYYKIAMTVACCGMSTSVIVMPPLSQFFRDTYGWRGTCLLLSGIGANIVLLSHVFKPLQEEHVERRTEYSLVSSQEEQIQTPTRWHRKFIESFDLSLFTDPSYVSLLIISSGNGFTITAWLIFLVPHALDVGFTPYNATAVATAGGVGNTVGNCVYPLLCKVMSNKAILYTSVCVLAASLALDPVASSFYSYAGMVACSFVYGFARGVMVTTWYVMVNDVVDNEAQMVNALGWSFGAYGVMSLLGGFLSGWLFDIFGSYTPSFLLLGGLTAVTFIPQCIVDIMQYKANNKNTSRSTSLGYSCAEAEDML